MEDRVPKRLGLAAMALAVLAAPVLSTGALAEQRNGSTANNNTFPGNVGQQSTKGKAETPHSSSGSAVHDAKTGKKTTGSTGGPGTGK